MHKSSTVIERRITNVSYGYSIFKGYCLKCRTTVESTVRQCSNARGNNDVFQRSTAIECIAAYILQNSSLLKRNRLKCCTTVECIRGNCLHTCGNRDIGNRCTTVECIISYLGNLFVENNFFDISDSQKCVIGNGCHILFNHKSINFAIQTMQHRTISHRIGIFIGKSNADPISYMSRIVNIIQ